MFHEYLAIDILALILPTRIYLIIVEKNHPHNPVTAILGDAVKHMTPEEKAFTRARIASLNAYTGAVAEALGRAASV